MKATIDIFDHFQLELGFEHEADGSLSIHKVFGTFLDRPDKPHLSVFFEPRDGVLTPHFTAGRGSRREFRRKLTRIRPDRVGTVLQRFGGEAVRQVAEALEPANLEGLEGAGWTVHNLDIRSIRRWLRLVRRQSTSFVIDAGAVAALISHVFRHRAPPTFLGSLRFDEPMTFLAIRQRADSGRHELGIVMHAPHGFGSVHPNGDPFIAAPAGWYTYPFDLPFQEIFGQVLPGEAVQKVGRDIQKYLARYPKRGAPFDDALLDDLPAYAAKILGFYVGRLLDAALHAVMDVSTAPARLTG